MVSDEMINKKAREVAGLKESYSRDLEALDKKIDRMERNPDVTDHAIQIVRDERANVQRLADDIIGKAQHELDILRAKKEREAQQRLTTQRQQAAAEEADAKAQARAAWWGTDEEFEAEWPKLWPEIRRKRAMDRMAEIERQQREEIRRLINF